MSVITKILLRDKSEDGTVTISKEEWEELKKETSNHNFAEVTRKGDIVEWSAIKIKVEGEE